MRRRYVFFDVDGTLVSHREGGRIPDATRRAVELLRREGHVPAIATARAAFLTRGVARELGIDLLVCCTGAHILNGAETLAAAWLPERALRLLREVAVEGFVRSAAMDDRHVYTDNPDKALRDYLEGQAGYACVRPVSELRRAFLAYSLSPDPEGSPLLRASAEDVVFDHTPHFVEVRTSGTSKWQGIREAARLLGFALEDVVTFGDGANDMEMLREAPVGVAVGGAPDPVKDMADFVADAIETGGILQACRSLGLVEGETLSVMGRKIMKTTLIRKAEQPVGTWAGGTTTQLAIAPEGADYAARRFAWRVSSARVDLDESDFTPLPGFHRILMILEGSVHLTHVGVREIDLEPFDQDSFEGSWRTRSRGRCVDFNVMTAPGWKGIVTALRPSGTARIDVPLLKEVEAFYCLRDADVAVIGSTAQTEALKAGDFLLVESPDPGASLSVSAHGDSPVGIHVRIFQGPYTAF